ncbi:MAG: hypothetical protein NTV34_10805 [Proteobacteria bacterium]|nr:hypothetical protein [Pseudomonadota bacterium]
MNSAPNQPQPGNTFGSQPAGTQNNPFTNDLKGEFSSNFGATSNFGTGTNTNAVSQIFKDGSFSGNSNKRIIFLVLGGLLVAGVAYWLMSSPTADDVVAEDPAEEPAKPAEVAPEVAATPAVVTPPVAAEPEAVPEATAAATSAIQLASPDSGASLAYDETQGSASFSWSGGPGTIVFSRHSSMQPEVMRVKVSSGNYSFHRPWPGQWYWKVENEGGASEIRSFSVSAPVRRNVSLSSPQAGGALAGTGGAVSWTGDKGVAYYRVELNQTDDWSNPQYKFSSSGSQAQLNGVTAGTYSLRLGACSEVSGRWEYTQPISVTVQ